MSALNLSIASAVASRDERLGIQVHPLCFFLAVLAIVLGVSDKLLQDPDTHWHIAVGRWIWETRSVPWTDVFSHTFTGEPWIAKEWVSQLIFYGAFEAGSWRGVAFLSALVIASSFALLFSWLRCRLQATAALAATLLAMILTSTHWLARPHLLVFPVLILWTAGLVGAVERRSPPPWWLVPLMGLWANLHGSFPIGFAIAGIMAGEAVMSVASNQRLATLARWSLFGAAAVLVGFATPYGVHAMAVALNLFGGGEALPFITEWRPLSFEPIGIFAGALSIVLLLALALEWKANLFRILLVALLGYMMMKHVRFMGLLGLVSVIVAAGPLARRFPVLAAPARDAPVSLPRLALISLLATVLAAGFLKSLEPSTLRTPSAALEKARTLGLAGPIYNHYDFGGFLIAAGVKTFIDGRTDQLFLGGFMTGLYRAIHAADSAAFASLLTSRGVTWALVKPDSEEVRHFSTLPGWSRVYQDDTAAVFARR